MDGHAPAAGWYPDSNDPKVLRWWDGTQWTHNTQIATPPPAAGPSEVAPELPVAPAPRPAPRSQTVQPTGEAPGAVAPPMPAPGQRQGMIATLVGSFSWSQFGQNFASGARATSRPHGGGPRTAGPTSSGSSKPKRS